MSIDISECSNEVIQKVVFEVLANGGNRENAKLVIRDTFNISDKRTLEQLIRGALDLGRLGTHPSTW